MLTRAECFFPGFDLSQLYMQVWQNKDAKATILITHGQAEHSDCYRRLIDGLNALTPYNFVAWDLRGHGKSSGARGYAHEFDDYVRDYNCFIHEAMKLNWVRKTPVILLGHSMGGLIQVCSLADNDFPKNFPILAQILSSPFFELSLPVPAWKTAGSKLINSLIPKLTLGNEIKNEMLTRDPDVIKEYEIDVYRHNKISAGVFLGIKEKFKDNITRAEKIKLPTYMCISNHDPIVSTPEALKFFDALPSPNKALKIMDEGTHELFNDIHRQDVFESINNFILNFLK